MANAVGVPVEKGPKDLREIPAHFGRVSASRAYGDYDIEILAEINNAPRLSRRELRAAADGFRAAGADIIDIGCTPGRAFPDLADVVRELVGAGMRVSVDSFDPAEIRTAVSAGAELVLSVNRSNLEVIPDLAGSGARVSDLEKQVDEAKRKQSAREAELSKARPEAPAAEGQPAPPKRSAADVKALIEADAQRNELLNTVQRLSADLEDARLQATVDDSRYLLPYRMKTIPITVPVFSSSPMPVLTWSPISEPILIVPVSCSPSGVQSRIVP